MHHHFRPTAILITVATLLLQLGGCAEIKQAGRTVGHTTKNVATDIGHASRDVAKSIGHGTRRVVTEITADSPESRQDD